MNLSPTQHHYFKRQLVTLQLEHEINILRAQPDLSLVLSTENDTQFPLLRLVFQHLILKFPLLKQGSEFWDKVQEFLDQFCKIDLNTFAPKQNDAAQRRLMINKTQKILVIALCAAIKTGSEESIKIDPRDLTPPPPSLPLVTLPGATLVIDIVGVRIVKTRHSLREKSHAEYIVQTDYNDKRYIVSRRHRQFAHLRNQLKASFPSLSLPHTPPNFHDTSALIREKDRLSLRCYLHSIAQEPGVAVSDPLLMFLTTDTYSLTQEDERDLKKRKEVDLHRAEEEQKFQAQLDGKVEELEALLDMLKAKIKQPGGLLSVFEDIKATEKIEDLPEPLRKALEWGRISFAFALHKQLVMSDAATENLANLKRTHGMMPYRTMAFMLKLSNPMAMLKGVMDLFLARPFGTKSLFQRMLLANMQEEAKGVSRDIDELEKKISCPALTEKLYKAVRTPLYGCTEAESRSSSNLLTVLQNTSFLPLLSDKDLALVFGDPGLQKKLHRLWSLYARQYEHDMMSELVFEGVTGELIKQLFTIFYQPLAQVYKAADIGSSLYHVSAFLDDLIALMAELEEEQKEGQDSAIDSIPRFIDIVQSHEQNFYGFVHKVYSQDTSCLFDDLLHYVDGLFGFMSVGLPGTIDLNTVVGAVNLSDSENNQLIEEIDDLCAYRHWQKVKHLEKTRNQLIAADKDPLQATTNHLSFLNGSQLEDEFREMEYESEGEGEGEGESQSTGSVSQSSEDTNSTATSSQATSSTKSSGMEFPTLEIIPKIVPYFVDSVSASIFTI
ncbi:hypothetical protein J3Q64DRAFT_1681218 [Phycomyces blakesleeanus]|uniref:PX domain-containing protein n=2 Tax=Phycomyces blakesleeanus TaxID=4837 RepID=A0A167JTI4_PHYB8|nr:hypothetical protein PHYBLDRAFT_152226 [Phycomyces blakesleeanus NRRL 1555(-)]OAD66678.1 hypothetical protein PHYBLDRAFT_152226 [Phycomyces blakesleeanus NRRL 1555(-)]|eukprot:XP_018284718.1 hypothetical protein PHYBLDRAFT_152226 [Phycomyces blakesleeanus NRRL 1555(-)]